MINYLLYIRHTLNVINSQLVDGRYKIWTKKPDSELSDCSIASFSQFIFFILRRDVLISKTF